MILALDAFRSWNNFTWLKNATKKLERQSDGNRHLLKAYLKVVDRIPFLQWEDCITKLSDIQNKVILLLGDNSLGIKKFPMDIDVFEPHQSYPGECYAACLACCGHDPLFEYWLGFCRTESDWHLHAFLVKEGKIFEPTGIIREVYTGLRIHNPRELLAEETLLLSSDMVIPPVWSLGNS